VKFVATEKVMTTNFFHPSLLLLFLDPGSGMGKNQDPGSGINIPDPQHCLSEKIYFKFDYDSELPVSEISFGIERKCLT
jgi:hypothetical protein